MYCSVRTALLSIPAPTQCPKTQMSHLFWWLCALMMTIHQPVKPFQQNIKSQFAFLEKINRRMNMQKLRPLRDSEDLNFMLKQSLSHSNPVFWQWGAEITQPTLVVQVVYIYNRLPPNTPSPEWRILKALFCGAGALLNVQLWTHASNFSCDFFFCLKLRWRAVFHPGFRFNVSSSYRNMFTSL